MSNHLIECKGCPQVIKHTIREMKVSKSKVKKIRKIDRYDSSSDNATSGPENEENQDVNKQTVAISLNTFGENPTNKENINSKYNVIFKKSKKTDIGNFFDKMTQDEQVYGEGLLAKAIYTSGIALHFIENEYIHEFIAFLRPKFKLPSRADILSNKLLDKIYFEVEQQVDLKISNASSIAIQCDSYTNIRNESITNIMLNTPEPVFFKTVETKSNSQSAEYLADLIRNVIDEIGSERILGICTDNASYCRKAWKLIEVRYEDEVIFGYGCTAHILKLLIKDITCQTPVDTRKYGYDMIRSIF